VRPSLSQQISQSVAALHRGGFLFCSKSYISTAEWRLGWDRQSVQRSDKRRIVWVAISARTEP
jgi:hypothetical protein